MYQIRTAVEQFLFSKNWTNTTTVYTKGREIQVEYNQSIFIFANVDMATDMRANVARGLDLALPEEDLTNLEQVLKAAEEEFNSKIK